MALEFTKEAILLDDILPELERRNLDGWEPCGMSPIMIPPKFPSSMSPKLQQGMLVFFQRPKTNEVPV